MQSLRQAAGGLIYALISIVLVLGSLSVAVAERNNIGAPATKATVAVSATIAAAATLLPATTPSATQAGATTVSSATSMPPDSSTPAIAAATATASRRPPTATHAASVSCGPFAGWIKGYVVQPGDSLFHIASLYRTTVTNLQRANCKTGTLIYAGERLWVPNVATATAGVTIIPPFFDTPTDESTPVVATDTPAPPTSTPEATYTSSSSSP